MRISRGVEKLRGKSFGFDARSPLLFEGLDIKLFQMIKWNDLVKTLPHPGVVDQLPSLIGQGQ